MFELFFISPCAGCHNFISYNPNLVPVLQQTVASPRLPICKSCFKDWNIIHRLSKGLKAVPLHPKAYVPSETELLLN